MNEKRSAYQKQYREQYKSRTKRVNLTFTNEEHRAFLRAAKAEGAKLSGYPNSYKEYSCNLPSVTAN